MLWAMGVQITGVEVRDLGRWMRWRRRPLKCLQGERLPDALGLALS